MQEHGVSGFWVLESRTYDCGDKMALCASRELGVSCLLGSGDFGVQGSGFT